MKTPESLISPALLVVVVLCCVATGALAQEAPARSPTTPEASQWLDASGDPLPFQDDEAVREALRSATLVSREPSSLPGLERLELLLLEADGARFHALLLGRGNAAKREIAASLIDELLGLHLVPPVVERTIGDGTAAVQIWRQGAGTAIEIERAGQLVPPDPKDFAEQRQAVYLFDNLIANSGRGQGNTVIDPGWRIWLIDHAGAFRPTSGLLHEVELTKCDRSLWQRLRSLDKRTLQELAAPYLEAKQVSALVARHRKVVRHIQGMITTFGEDVVLFDGSR